MMENRLKAKFCRKHFTSLLTFVNHCDIENNDFGTGFLRDLVPEDDKQIMLSWQLENNDRLREEELMLGMEEFWAITEKTLKEQRDQTMEILTNDAAPFQSRLNFMSFVEVILDHFGGMNCQELQKACPSIGQFTKFLNLLTEIRMPAHKKDEDKNRKLQIIHMFAAIGLTALLRKEWNKPGTTLSGKYKAPPAFEMPEQKIFVNINIKKPSNCPNKKISDQLDVQERHMSFYMKVKKYEPFKVDLSYGRKDFLLKKIEVEQTLTFYYWNTRLDITIPSEYETHPIIVHLVEDWARDS